MTMTAVAASSSAATAVYKYTYTLGRSLYVPVTSRCNSVPLPVTRGPNFLLPRTVAEALVRFRNAETGSSIAGYGDLFEENDGVNLPPYDSPLVNSLYHFSNDIRENIQQQRQNALDQQGSEMDDYLQPSIATLVNEVSSRLNNRHAGNLDSDDPGFSQVVIAGEGEPMLRMDALLAVARSVQAFRTNDNERSNEEQQSKKPASFPVRVITNGLCYGIPNLGYSPYNNHRSSSIIPMHRHVILKDMMDAGISQLSVAMNTANRHEYDVLMEPCCHTGGGIIGGGGGGDNSGPSTLMPGTAHDIVCEFILEATKVGMEVEITGVLRPELDRKATERLARLLLSVRPKHKKGRMVRWRRYFEHDHPSQN